LRIFRKSGIELGIVNCCARSRAVSRKTNMGKVAAKADKPMRDAILAALENEVAVKRGGKAARVRRLTLIADQLVTLGVEGNLAAIREICDRIDGKAVVQMPAAPAIGRLIRMR
jgi:hypothetical protein